MHKFDILYMDIAKRIAEMSFSSRSKVGCVIVKGDNIIAFGWNGMPRGYPNECETNNITHDEVIHAEENAICKAARQGIPLNGATLYITLSPCQHCSKLILQSGIKKVIYLEEYRINTSISFLTDCNVDVSKFE